ncbi:MAG: hypothetical protein MJ025_06035 [Victivallaceae bacterium]|nr:hypothetical protein [Victivallaceae bacterium]
MATKAKMSKHSFNTEIKGALFSDSERFEMWFSENWKRAMIWSAAAVVAVTVGFGLWRWSVAVDRKAAAELSSASDIASVKKAIADNPRHRGVGLARFRLARMYMDDGLFDESAVELAKVIGAPGDAVLKVRSQVMLAYVDEKRGGLDKAAGEFEKLARDGSCPPAVRAECLYGAVRLAVDRNDIAKAEELVELGKHFTGTGMATAFWNARTGALESVIAAKKVEKK